ncbi:hypothetical protein DTO169C6_9006 [Paecilomyces variotii]|nr:hypothetical protein DTO169C6_9006 [Paecilomyces variotii]
MGLAGPRKRTKISHDPNNTNWARSTSGFGHKIMSSQGWTPGSLLGARDAAHADHFTAGSASHIRVSLKDDTLGLGARPKRDLIDGPTGLDAFQGLLGRLNGKTDAELEKEQRKRDDVKLAIYTARKWQAVRFVSGGLLVPEKMEALPNKTREEPDKQGPSAADSAEESQPESESEKEKSKKSKKSKKPQKSKKGDSDVKPDADSRSSSKSKRKESKKRKHGGGSDQSDDNQEGDEEQKAVPKPSKSKDAETNGSQTSSRSETPATSRERIPMGRHIFRSRHIQQKKKALMDDKSLNEIFMIKS